MPLHGKIVVIKRSGGDGTEFPLTATCMFGRKPDCDIRIQLPQVSKEHCRIDLNENKEVVLTNLSSVNPTRINGEALQQAERLKHGDVITVIDRSFRFEYPPAPTPKKRASAGGKTETLKVLQDQQVVDTLTVETGDKKLSEVFTDGANHDNIRRTLDNTVEVESKEDVTQLQNKTNSPFSDLYQMIKKSLDVKTPRKSSASLLQTPASKFCTPQPASVRKSEVKPVIFKEDQGTPKMKKEAKVTPEADKIKGQDESCNPETPKSVKKQRKASLTSSENPGPAAEEVDHVIKSETTSPQRRTRVTPQKFTAAEVMKQVCVETPKSPVRRSSRETTPVKSAVTAVEPEPVQRKSPRNSGKAEQVDETTKKRKGGKLAADLPTSQMKRKRVSFGGALSPELFDKRLPPNSPLCKGAFPRRSLCLNKPKESLLRRASVIGLLKPKASSPGKKSPNSRSSSPKAASPGKKSPKSATPAKKSPKTPSPVRGSSPTVQGRFSVSRISTPSPVTEDSVTCTPKIPLNRKSMKSTSRKTPIIGKSAVKGIRRSGISRASMKVKNSWVDIVKFGQPKAQVIAPVIKMVTKKTTKKIVSKPQTPARNIKGHVSTGHADSPATIIVGRAHTQSVLQPTGAAPRVVTNIALLKKNMKMDEDLTGISQMYKTPVNEKKTRSGINKRVDVTPVAVLGTTVVEPSILNTPEGPGEMVVSPLNLASTVKDRSYNSEAVQRLLNEDKDSSFVSVIPALEIPSDESSEQQSTKVETSPVKTPKRNPEQPECLSGSKRITRTPKQKPEPVEDLRGKILKTPKQKPEQQECLTGVKRIMKTPKQKIEQQECLTGVKKIFETPQKEAEPLEEPQETPAHVQESEDLSEMADVKTLNAKSSPVLCVETELDFANEDLQEDKPSDVIEVVPQVDTVKAVSDEVVNDTKEEPSEKESSDIMETISQAAEDESSPEEQPEVNAVVEEEPEVDAVVEEEPKVDAVVEEEPKVDAVVEEEPEVDAVVEEEPKVDAVVEEEPKVDAVVEEEPEVDAVVEEQPKVDAVVEEQPKVDAVVEEQPKVDAVVEEQPKVDAVVAPVQEKKPVRGRRAKTVEPEAVEDKQDAAQHSEEPVTPAPVRGKRGKKTETPAPSTVQKKTRSRNAKTTESNDADLTVEENASQPPKIESKPKRGRNAKKASDDQAELVATETENAPEAECEQIPAVEVDHKADESAAQEKAAPKLKRARKPKQETEPSQPEQQDVAKEHSEDPVVPAPVRVRRGKKTEATAAPAVRQTTKTRNARSQGNASDDKPEAAPETSLEMQPEIPSEAESEQTAPPAEEAVVKPVRGRKTKPTPVAPSQSEPESAEVSDEPQQHIPTAAITRRGRKIKSDTTEQTGAAEDTLVTVETKQESQPPVRVKRGRNAKQEEEKQATSDVQEPVKKPTRTRKTKEELVKPKEEEIKTDETVVPEEAESLFVVKPLEMNEQAPVTEKKTRRVGKKAKQAAESETTVESTEVEEVPAVKPKRGRRVKEATEVVAEVPEAEEKTAEPDAPVVKPTRARGVKTVKNQVSEVIPAKRARRVAATLPEDTESTALDFSVPAAEPAKRGKRTAAKSKADELMVSSDQVNTSEALTSAVTEDVKGSKRSVKGKADREVLQIPKATPVKAVRGKKSKLVDAESTNASHDADKTEEKDLSEEVVEAQPIKRARRVKVTEETVDPKKDAEAETQPKTRRARTTKK
ncbi:proliferation marker protein Ki-67 isoform X3 [Platichthys flesus]|uniref:proliferation marker protein Ki-67 isoform X3 n=1 Tax=Platichthys flesus TaxID=8260 RepID=UPI002DB991DE|nr:proliferation marker protein Ki-67 isoform X3 [Platichthys flesus]